jgi:fatty acid amide hydrolase 2
MWMETNNRVYGRTNNPYDPSRIVGGSSGGEGAIIGAGASPFGVGSDIGGSIRMPAFFNGVFGHKPTGGLVPGTGQYPIAQNEALRYLSTGPLCRRAEDLMPLLAIVAGPDGRDGGCRAMPLGEPAAVDLAGLRVLDVASNGVVPVSRDLQQAQRRAAQALEARGAVVTRGAIKGLRHSLEVWAALLESAGGTPFSELLGDGRKVPVGRELLRWVARRSPHTLPALALAGLEDLAARLPGLNARFVKVGEALKRELVDRIGDGGVMLYPSYASVAPRHYQPVVLPLRWVYTAILNVMELPVTQVPLGLDGAGLPLGVQVAGTPGQDHVTIAVAQALEADFGGWVPPGRRPTRRPRWAPAGW